MLLAPFDQADILVNDELDAIGHGFQAGKGHQALHGGGDHMIAGFQPRLAGGGERAGQGATPLTVGHEQADGHDQGEQQKDAQHHEGHRGRFAAAANGEIPRRGDQAGSDEKCQTQVMSVAFKTESSWSTPDRLETTMVKM